MFMFNKNPVSSAPIVPPAATIRASTVTGLWKGLNEVNALLGADFPYSPVKCSLLSHKSLKNNSDKLQHTNQCDAESNAYFCNLWSQNQPKKACGKLRTLEDSCGQQLENSDVIHLHPSPMLQGELLLFCFVASLWLFDSDVTLQYSQEAQRKKTCRMILNFVCHSTLPMMKRCRGCPKQTKRHKTVHGTAGRCVLNWGSSQWHHSCNDLNQERSIQDITKTFDTAKCLSSIVIWIFI